MNTFSEFYGKGDWFSIDAGMDAMGLCKVIRIVHERRGMRGYILVDFLSSAIRIRRIKIQHKDIISKVKNPKEVQELERRLQLSTLAYDVKEKEEK